MAVQAMDLSKRMGQFVTNAFGGERVRPYLHLPPDPPLQLEPLLDLIEMILLRTKNGQLT